jgi:hypothetical protein
MNVQQELEVRWYRLHGNYPKERVRPDRQGRPYVVGDEGWNRLHPRLREYVEDLMPRAPLPCRR